MTRDIFRYGALGGLIVGIPLFAIAVITGNEPPPGWGMWFGFATMLVAFSLIFVAVKRERDTNGGGVIRFWPALGMGLGIAFVASLFWVFAWEAALTVVGGDFGAIWTKVMIEDAQKRGASAAEIAKLTREMAEFSVNYRNPLYRLPMTFAEIFPIGAIVALLSAAVLRSPKMFPAKRA